MKLSELSTEDLTYRRSEIVLEIRLLKIEHDAIKYRRALTEREKSKLSNLNRLQAEYDAEIKNRQPKLF